MEQFAQYGHAIVAVAVWALISLGLNLVSVLPKAGLSLAPGETPRADYADKVYRTERAYINTTESLAVMAAVVTAAILAGASPFWVNLFASLALLSRIAMVVVHMRGIGKPVGGPRTGFFVLGWGLQILIALMAIFAAF